MSNFDIWGLVKALWLLLVGVVAWMGRRAILRLEHLENNAVLKADFDKAISDMKEERTRMHRENLDILKRLEDKIDLGAQATMAERTRQLEARVDQLDRRK